jgi:hypothetical protein
MVVTIKDIKDYYTHSVLEKCAVKKRSDVTSLIRIEIPEL